MRNARDPPIWPSSDGGLARAQRGVVYARGAPLPSPIAPSFTLVDEPTGDTVSLSSLPGQVVLVTFLYTGCPDICPLTAETLREAHAALGDSARGLTLIAVSVDPVHDTPEATRRFLEEHRLQGVLRYLVGSRAQLAQVWSQYGVLQAAGAGTVAHTDVIYLIDKHARGRVVLHSDVSADVLASDLRILINER